MGVPKTTTITQKKYEELVKAAADLKETKRLLDAADRVAHSRKSAIIEKDAALKKALDELNKYQTKPTPSLALLGMATSVADAAIRAITPSYHHEDRPMVQPSETAKMLSEVHSIVGQLLKAAQEDVKNDVTYIKESFKER